MPEEQLYMDPNSGLPMQSQYPPYAMPKPNGTEFLDKIDPGEVVIQVRHMLMGENEVNGKFVPEPSLQSKALSPAGAWWISSLMYPVSSKTILTSNLQKDELKKRLLSIAKVAQKMALVNWKEYGIKTADQFDFIHEIVYSNTLIALKQAEEGGIQHLIGKIKMELGYVAPNMPEKTSGWMSSVASIWKKR